MEMSQLIPPGNLLSPPPPVNLWRALRPGEPGGRLASTFPLAHIFGIPVEETTLSAAPVVTVLGLLALAQLRRVGRRATSVKQAAPGERAPVRRSPES